ncbi:MAG TPA: hypothetical protein VNS32_13350 [Flavisolibacter sp.]|nr:hypothetical protein [Flavisolibacter sp.]
MKELMSGAGTLIYLLVIPVISPLIALAYGCTRLFLVIGWVRSLKVVWSPIRFHHLLSRLSKSGFGMKRLLPAPRRFASAVISKS